MDIAQQLYNRFRKTKVSNNIWQLYKALELLDLVSRFLEHHKDRYKIKILPLTHISNGGKHRRNPKKNNTTNTMLVTKHSEDSDRL